MPTRRFRHASPALVLAATVLLSPAAYAAHHAKAAPVHHVLLISIDGFHAIDLAKFIRANPSSALAQLSAAGTTFTNASQVTPDDSFPGMVGIATGGSPQTTGVWYDVTYDRTLLPAGGAATSPGVIVTYTEDIDRDPTRFDAGGGIDSEKLPIDPATKQPVFPHTYVRVNTVFEVVKSSGMRTAWSDKHPAYEILNGPSGQGVDDLFDPEIEANGTTKSVAKTEAYDDTKVTAILNEIDGKDHTGTTSVGVPALFGMNFQAVSIGEKLKSGGYADPDGTPGPELSEAIAHTDRSIGKLVAELKATGLYGDTAIIITAKHGQQPLDVTRRRLIPDTAIPAVVNGVQPGLLALATQDCGALLWLTDQSRTADVAAALRAHQADLGIEKVLYGPTLALNYDDPAHDTRTPDLIVVTQTGVIIAGASSTKIGEHGGFDEDNTHVALLVESPGLTGNTVTAPVHTTQIAPTILLALGLNPGDLQAVQQEKTQALPGLPY
ncbi:MAG: alkaline phosphatase family protein [Capsulimonadaceae bacterium]